MPPQEISFIVNITNAILDRLEARLGSGGLYDTPTYLHLRTTFRAGGEPVPSVPEADQPAMWLEYIAGSGRGGQIGGPGVIGQEVFTLFARLTLTPESMGMASRDVDDFREWAEASVDTFLRRIRANLAGWSPGVVDSLTGDKTTGLFINLWTWLPQKISDLKLVYHLIVRINVPIEP